MSGARTRILASISRALNRDGAPPTDGTATRQQADYAGTMAPRPAWTGALPERFIQTFESQAGTWGHASDAQAVTVAVSEFLAAKKLEPHISLAAHALLEAVQWPGAMVIKQNTEEAWKSTVAVSVAEAGIAETGTLVLYSGPKSPTSLAFLPEFHIVVLPLTNLVGYMEDVWELLQPRGTFPPRSLNFITGPSRTADVEQTIQLGAHGPRGLHLILVGLWPPPPKGEP